MSMPSKFRKNIWIKRGKSPLRVSPHVPGLPSGNRPNVPLLFNPLGDFLIVDPIKEGQKVKAEICFVLCKDHVRSLQEEGLW